MFAVKLSTDHEVSIVEKKPGQSILDFCYETIGCELVEQVSARGLKEPYVLMVDEEGQLKDEPTVNFIASYLYGTHEHREPIVGNALVLKMAMTDEGPDIVPLDEPEARQVKESMDRIAHIAYRKVLLAFRQELVGPFEEETER